MSRTHGERYFVDTRTGRKAWSLADLLDVDTSSAASRSGPGAGAAAEAAGVLQSPTLAPAATSANSAGGAGAAGVAVEAAMAAAQTPQATAGASMGTGGKFALQPIDNDAEADADADADAKQQGPPLPPHVHKRR